MHLLRSDNNEQKRHFLVSNREMPFLCCSTPIPQRKIRYLCNHAVIRVQQKLSVAGYDPMKIIDVTLTNEFERFSDLSVFFDMEFSLNTKMGSCPQAMWQQMDPATAGTFPGSHSFSEAENHTCIELVMKRIFDSGYRNQDHFFGLDIVLAYVINNLCLDERNLTTWICDEGHCGGHPWEIAMGGNSTHISLSPVLEEDGWFWGIRGTAWTRNAETCRGYLALDRVGIVPQGIVPAYCRKLFPDEIVIDYFNLHLDMGSRAVSRIHWYPEKKLIPASP